MRFVSPTPSYEVALPDDIVEEYDGRVASFWRNGSSVLLQLSSTLRSEGVQVTAAERLEELLKRSPADWSGLDLSFNKFSGEWAAAQMQDEKGVKWVHIYLTTPSVAIYATISGRAMI